MRHILPMVGQKVYIAENEIQMLSIVLCEIVFEKYNPPKIFLRENVLFKKNDCDNFPMPKEFLNRPGCDVVKNGDIGFIFNKKSFENRFKFSGNNETGYVELKMSYRDLQNFSKINIDAKLEICDNTFFEQLIVCLEETSHQDIGECVSESLNVGKQKQSDASTILFPKKIIEGTEGLEEKFPNMAAVVSFIRKRALAMDPSKPFTLPPIVICGPNGIGKTEFVRTFAERVGTIFRVVSCSQNPNGALAMSGSDKQWRNAKQGLLSKTLEQTASPIFFLDELDKSPQHGANLVPPLTDFLLDAWETSSAKNMIDEYIGHERTFDATRVLWFASVNTTKTLPLAVRSRAVFFNVTQPGKNEMRNIANNILQKVLADLGRTNVRLSDGALDILQDFPPRYVKLLIDLAVSNVLAKSFGGDTVVVRPEDVAQAKQFLTRTMETTMGFSL